MFQKPILATHGSETHQGRRDEDVPHCSLVRANHGVSGDRFQRFDYPDVHKDALDCLACIRAGENERELVLQRVLQDGRGQGDAEDAARCAEEVRSAGSLSHR